MKIYKLPINFFEKDLSRKIKKHLQKVKYTLKLKFYLFIIALVLSSISILIGASEGSLVLCVICIVIIGIWFGLIKWMKGKKFYNRVEINEKVISKNYRSVLFLKLDFLTKSKKGEDITGSVYVNNPESDYLTGIYTLHVRNKKFITTETINKNANEIKDVDDYFSLEELEVDKGAVGDKYSNINVVKGGDPIKEYEKVVRLVKNKYGIKVNRIELLIMPFWECTLQDNRNNNRKVRLDTVWGNKINFNNINLKDVSDRL
jgi:hypothetical protein